MLPVVPAIKQPALAAQMMQALTTLILQGQVRSGQYLPSEAELSKQFDVSRSTVREAVSVLEARGLVQRRHGVGIVVTDRSQAAAVGSLTLLLQRRKTTLRDLLEVRVGLERLVAALAATHATAADIAAMDDALAPMRRAGSGEDEYVGADLAFHLRLAEASHNAVYVVLVDAVRELLLESIRATYRLDGHTARRLRDHAAILDAVRAHDAPTAARAMCAHLHSTEAMLRQLGLIEGAAITAPLSPAEGA